MKKLLFLVAVLTAISTIAQDRVFTYNYQSNILNKGQKELEVWTTFGTGRQDYYHGLKHSLEFEIGLGTNLQTSFYLNLWVQQRNFIRKWSRIPELRKFL